MRKKNVRVPPFFSFTPLIEFHLKIGCPRANEDRHLMAIVFIVVGRLLSPRMQHHWPFLLPGLSIQLCKKPRQERLSSLYIQPHTANCVPGSAFWTDSLGHLRIDCTANNIPEIPIYPCRSTYSYHSAEQTRSSAQSNSVISLYFLTMTKLFLMNHY